MKVLEIFGEPISNGGQESFVMNVLGFIDMKNTTFDLLTPYYCDNNYYKNIVEEKGGNIYCFNFDFVPGKSRLNLLKKTKDFLSGHKYDVVHIHSGSISALTIISFAAYLNKVKKIIVHSHCSGASENIKHMVVKKLYSPLMSIFATDFCACSLEAAEWKFTKRIVRDKVVILKNGIDIEKFKYNIEMREQIRKKICVDKGDYVVGHVGRFSYEKNHIFLLDVFGEIKKIQPQSKLVLIGSGDEEMNIREKVKSDDLEKDVIFLGNVNNVNDYMQAFDVFVLPSLYEGLGIVGIEAQASGLPVIASKNVPTDMKVTDNVIFLDLAEDKKIWAKKICECGKIQRQDTRKDIASKGFNICSTANDVRKMYLL